MRLLLVAALLAVGCGSIDETGPGRGNPDAIDYGNCPDINAPNFDGYPCDPANQGNDSDWTCGIVDASSAVSPRPFVKRDTGCVAYAIDLVTSRNCVAKCP